MGRRTRDSSQKTVKGKAVTDKRNAIVRLILELTLVVYAQHTTWGDCIPAQFSCSAE